MQNLNSKIFFFSQRGNIYYAKIVLIEIVNTFFFVLSYLLVIYKPSLRTVDEILKGLALGIILWVCYFLSAGAGACYNPALALAQTTYQVGYLNTLDQNGNGFASLLWVYMVMPFIGAIFAALFFRWHIYLDNKALQQMAVGPGGRRVAA